MSLSWSRRRPSRPGRYRMRLVIAKCDCGAHLTGDESPPVDIIEHDGKLVVLPTVGTRSPRVLGEIGGYEWLRI